MKRHQLLLWGALITLIAIMFSFTLEWTGLTTFLEMKSYDKRLQWRNLEDSKIDKDVVVVMVDEASLSALEPLVGRWPWPRSIWGEVLSFLESAEVKAVLFDILFTEPQMKRDKKGQLGEDDQILVEASQRNLKTVHAFQLIEDTPDEVNRSLLGRKLPNDFIEKYAMRNLQISYLKPQHYNNYYLPLTELYQKSFKVGVVEFSSDSDGIYRRTQLIRNYQGHFFPTLSLAYLIDHLKIKKMDLDRNFFALNQLKIPLQEQGDYFINLKDQFENYSISGILATIQDLQQGKTEGLMVNPEQLKNKIVIIGGSAVGVEDLKASSLGQNLPGVYLHASIISNIINQEFINRLTTVQLLPITLLLIILIILSVVKGKGWFWPHAVFPLVALIYGFLAFILFRKYLIWIPFVTPLIAMAGSFIGAFIYMSFTEGREKRRTRKMLSQYVSPAVLTEVMDQKSTLSAEIGQKQEITVFFSDIRGFTTFSEKYPGEQVVEQLNYYLNQMVEIIFDHRGTLDKFIGDAVMAFWGAPIKATNHAELALLSALKMREMMPAINNFFSSKDYPAFEIGMGINTGEVILGNIGSEKKLDYTIIGDQVNLGARLEGLTKTYHIDLLISESTYQSIPNRSSYPSILIDRVSVKGKERPITIYYPLPLNKMIPEEIQSCVEMSQLAFDAYRNRKWEYADEYYSKLARYPLLNGYAELFRERILFYKSNPPEENWDGHFTMETK